MLFSYKKKKKKMPFCHLWVRFGVGEGRAKARQAKYS